MQMMFIPPTGLTADVIFRLFWSVFTFFSLVFIQRYLILVCRKSTIRRKKLTEENKAESNQIYYVLCSSYCVKKKLF